MKRSNLKWYIVATLPQREQKVAQLLNRKKLRAFCPMSLSHPFEDDETETSEEQEFLFPDMVFVQMEQKDEKFVRSIKEVVNFVYWLDQPVIVHEDEIDFLLAYASGCFFLQKEKIAIVQGASALITRENSITNVSGQLNIGFNTIYAYLPSIGYQIQAELNNVNFGFIKQDRESPASA